jgi:hypothetical protein
MPEQSDNQTAIIEPSERDNLFSSREPDHTHDISADSEILFPWDKETPKCQWCQCVIL